MVKTDSSLKIPSSQPVSLTDCKAQTPSPKMYTFN